jgi:membrane protein YqaA with SNARE-associated domain
MSTLTDIASEAFLARLLPFFHHEVTLNAMHAFGEPPPIAMAAAGAAGLAASAILYGVGVWLRRLPKKISTPEQQARIEKIRGVAVEWLPWLLILVASPVGGLLAIAAGFFAIRPAVAALAMLGGEVLWRISPLL